MDRCGCNMQVMFLRMDFAGLVAELPAMQQAHLYSEWMDADRQPRRRQVNGNAWLQKAAKLREAVMAKPRACFDAEFYIMVRSSFAEGKPEKAMTRWQCKTGDAVCCASTLYASSVVSGSDRRLPVGCC